MSEQQQTFGDVMGMDPMMPTRHHPNDMIVCEDTSDSVRYADCHFAADDTAFEDRDERDEYDLEALRAFFEGLVEWSDEYRGSQDCADDYAFLVSENPGCMLDNVKEWIDYNYDDHRNFDARMIDDICTDLVGYTEMKISHGCFGSSDHAVTFDSFDCGEVEEQIEVSGHDLLIALHGRGDLEGMLGELEGEFCIHCWGREGSFVSGDCITFFNNTDVWYHAGCDEETMQDVWDIHAGLILRRLFALCDDSGKHVRYVAQEFYRPTFNDFTEQTALDLVTEKHGWDGPAEFVDHSDFPSESADEHQCVIDALKEIVACLDNTDETGYFEWAEEALDDARADYADRYGADDE